MRNVCQISMTVVFLPVLILSISTASQSQVMINEFMPDPATDWDGDGEVNYRDDEWVEIKNRGDSAVDLSGYLLADGIEEPQWRYGLAGQLMPGEVLVVFGSDSRAWEESNQFPRYGLSLNNSGDRISVFRVENGDTVCIHYYTYQDEVVGDDRSVGISADPQEGWVVFDAYSPCDGACGIPGSGCIPTPGSPNQCTTGVESESWGSIKQKFSR